MDALNLWDHQHETLHVLENNERTFDFSDPGTGKTLVALLGFLQRRENKGKKAIVVAPKSLLKSAWGNEITDNYPGFTYAIAYAPDRITAFQQDADVVLINTDGVKWLSEQNIAFFHEYDTLIVDELHYFKNRTSGRSKALKKITKRFKYRHGMTGTPNSNTITDVWHQALLIDDGERLGTSFFHFRNSVCEPKQVGPMPNMIKWTDKEGAEEAVASLLGDICVRHAFDSCMDIPPNHKYKISYTLPKSNRKQYDLMLKNAVLELEKDTVSAVNQAALRTKLMQIAAGVVYADNKERILDTERAELVIDLVEKRKHSLVFFNWTHQKNQLVAQAQKRGITYEVIDGSVPIKRREEIVEAYQAGFFQTLFLHPKTGAHGLTLTKGTATIWVSPIYEPDYLKQGLHRVYRGGQTLPTETILIEAENTIEQKVYSILEGKEAKMTNLLNLLRG